MKRKKAKESRRTAEGRVIPPSLAPPSSMKFNRDALIASALAAPPDKRFVAFVRALYEQMPEDKQDRFLGNIKRWLNDQDAADSTTPATPPQSPQP